MGHAGAGARASRGRRLSAGVGQGVPRASSQRLIAAGVGAQDTGQYQVKSPTGMISLSWQYEVIRLWQMSAESLLALHRAALMPLVGQTRITQPQEVLPRVVARIKQEPDAERR
jgi:hypothetical protein